MAIENFITRFWSKVDRSGGPDSCWIWTAAKDSHGYGVFKIAGHQIISTRIAWELERGRVMSGLCLLHDCPGGDNPACVNPAHLWLGTKRQNNNDAAIKGQHASKLRPADVKDIFRRANGAEKNIDLAREYEVHPSVVSLIKNKKLWKHITSDLDRTPPS